MKTCKRTANPRYNLLVVLIQEVVECEQLLNSMTEEVRVWVAERKPKTCAKAGELTDDYVQARKNGKAGGYTTEDRPTSNPLGK